MNDVFIFTSLLDYETATFLFQWVLIVILVSLSGMFSGLNLGLMSLDKLGLEIVIQSGTPRQSLYAKRIYPIRKRGNLLLCTILLGNVSVNALLSILLANFTTGVIGFLLSTIIIVICGEIVPQAACSRHGLAVGYYTVWLVWAFLIILLPFSYPISKALDLVLGRELGTIYSRNELKKLLEMHSTYSDITEDETAIMSGALDFGSKHVKEIMTPLRNVFMISVDDCLNVDTISTILEKGFSRIPVYEGSKDKITGLLFVKDLALLNPEDNLPVRKILQVYGRNLPRIFDDTTLAEVLSEFKRGHSHMAVVRTIHDTGDGDPVYENIGIVTLEDVIEEILQDEIIDETDIIVDNKSQRVIGRKNLDYKGVFTSVSAKLDNVNEYVDIIRGVNEFSDEYLSDLVIGKLVQQSPIIEISSPDHRVYVEGKAESFCVIVLKGALQFHVGDQIIEKPVGSSIGLKALILDYYIPEGSAYTTEPTTIIKITKHAYTAAIQATVFERHEEAEVFDDF